MVYKADGETITGKEEYFYLDPAKVDSIKVYTYDGTNYTPTARTVFDYLSGTKLVSAEKTDKYTGGKWVKETEKVYTASSAYHKSHAVSELAAEEGDNLVKLTWKAPEGADGLSGYKVYANDVLCKRHRFRLPLHPTMSKVSQPETLLSASLPSILIIRKPITFPLSE